MELITSIPDSGSFENDVPLPLKFFEFGFEERSRSVPHVEFAGS